MDFLTLDARIAFMGDLKRLLGNRQSHAFRFYDGFAIDLNQAGRLMWLHAGSVIVRLQKSKHVDSRQGSCSALCVKQV